MFALTALFCAAQVLGMLSNATFPALIPVFAEAWGLSNSGAGLVSGAYYAGYMAAVPILVGLTDRAEARRIYLGAQALGAVAALGFALFAGGLWSALLFRAVAGVGLAGTYMVGARMLADRVESRAQSRAVTWYTAHFAIGTSLSVLAAGEVAARLDWRWAFGLAAGGHVAALALVVLGTRPRPPTQAEASDPEPGLGGALDPRPVLRNRAALGYILGYAAHVWELFGFRTWLVAFLSFALATRAGTDGAPFGLTPTQLATVLLILGMPSSILGNEAAVRYGRRRALSVLMLASAVVACGLGFAAGAPAWGLLAALVVYAMLVTADSGALTAGTIAATEPGRRGATMALHTLIGFGAGVVGPLVAGAVLDLAGGAQRTSAWGLAFASMGLGAALGPVALALCARAGGRRA